MTLNDGGCKLQEQYAIALSYCQTSMILGLIQNMGEESKKTMPLKQFFYPSWALIEALSLIWRP